MLRMHGIAKSYGSVRANRSIDLEVAAGRIVGLLGENGSGKTTLMNVLFGMVAPDAGTITFKDRTLAGHTPREAIAAGIGMIHQHFMLVPAMTVTENVMLGWDATGRWLHHTDVAEKIRAASSAYGLGLDPAALVEVLPLGAQQRVEIVKAILHGAELLVLDEPTSSLSPPEIAGLLTVLRRLRDEGRSVIFISHKLGEVLEVCDEVVVLRDGEVAGRRGVAGVSRRELAHMMVGRDVGAPIERRPREPGPERLIVADLTAVDGAGIERVRGVSFSVRAGEVLALVGVDGNGQAELARAIGGIDLPSHGSVFVDGSDVTAGGVAARRGAGLAHVPADRGSTGLVGEMTVAENLALRAFDEPPLRRGPGSTRARSPNWVGARSPSSRSARRARGRRRARCRAATSRRSCWPASSAEAPRSCWPSSPRAASIRARPASSSSRCSRCARQGALCCTCRPIWRRPCSWPTASESCTAAGSWDWCGARTSTSRASAS
jgi:simple sugar transport system ATP-binding protein